MRVWSASVLVIWLGACGGPEVDPGGDGGSDEPCAQASDCSDGLFCNGDEICAPGTSGADARGCVAGTPECAGQTCDEDANACGCGSDPDTDADGHDSSICGGDDCDDSDALRYPGNTEICDSTGHDEDCEPLTYGFRDADLDGVADELCCNDVDGTRTCGIDCNDMAPGINPTTSEVCDGFDNDCDDEIDERVSLTLYVDDDGDGFGSDDDTLPPLEGCPGEPGYSMYNTDCDDDVAQIHPGAMDTCDTMMLDEDCDGVPNNQLGGCDCTAGEPPQDCPGAMGDCAGGTQTCIGGTWSACTPAPRPEVCDMRDNDCDGTDDNGVATVRCWDDSDRDGYAGALAVEEILCPTPAGMCPDQHTSLAPLGSNIDCSDVDASQHVPIVCYNDLDGDTWGSGTGTPTCDSTPTGPGGCATGAADRGGDCCEQDNRVHPGQTDWFYPQRDAKCPGGAGWDFDCSGSSEREFPVASTLMCRCTDFRLGMCIGECALTGGSPGWSFEVESCGSNGTYYEGCAFDADNLCMPTFLPRQQRCH